MKEEGRLVFSGVVVPSVTPIGLRTLPAESPSSLSPGVEGEYTTVSR